MRARHRLAQRRRVRAGVETVGNHTCDYQSRPSALARPSALPLPWLFRSPGLPATDPIAFGMAGAVATVRIYSGCFPDPPVPRSAPAHPFVHAGTLPALYSPLLMLPGFIPGVKDSVARFPTCSDGPDHLQSRPVGWFGLEGIWDFRCVSPLKSCCPL